MYCFIICFNHFITIHLDFDGKDEVQNINRLFHGSNLDDSFLLIKFNFITKSIIEKGL